MGLLRNRRFLGSLAAALATLVTMALTVGERDQLTLPERIVRQALAPLERAVSAVAEHGDGIVGALARYPRLYSDYTELSDEIERLQGLENELILLRRENERLREMLDFSRRHDYQTISAEIIARTPTNWNRHFIINRGRRNGVSPSQVVTDPCGVVGRVVSVTANTAEVMLLSSPESGIGAAVRRSGDAGVVSGVLGRCDRLVMTFFSPTADVAVGDVVVSSGFGRIFPPDLPVGTVLEVQRDRFGLLKRAVILPSSELDRVREVIVLLGTAGGDDIESGAGR